MAVSRTVPFFFISFFCFFFLQSTSAGSGVGTVCCNLAKQLSAFTDKSIPKDNYTCGQSYDQDLPAAPILSVPRDWCRQHCSGYALSSPSDTSAWATPLIQYILPAVIFSMTIPRRLVLEPPRWCFDFDPHHLDKLPQAILSLCVAGVIITLDTAVWVFMIMVAPAPFIFSGLTEIVIDHSVIRQLDKGNMPSGADRSECLDRKQRVQLLTAIVAGNLSTHGVPSEEGVPANPQQELGGALDVDRRPEEVEVQLRAMLAGQYPFGAAVGAPILLYIGSFIYTIATLHNAEGDNDTARALAFGIWWMNMVHVSAISGCLLASNNPSTAAAIVSRRRIEIDVKERLDLANDHSETEDRVQARLEAWSRLSLSYRARYEAVWMWTRGKSKASWLRETSAWKQPWFRNRIEITIQGWILLTLMAYSLVLLPCSLALWIEYSTPAKGPGCRSLTILTYACAQFVFVLLSAWSHFKVSRDEDYWETHTWLNCLRQRWVGVIVSTVLLFPAWVAAMFTTIAGTLMQVTGIYQNCTCNSTGYWSFPPGSIVSLATDTEVDRRNSRYWRQAGYGALGFLACVTYLAWWCQRYLREKFIKRVKNLVGNEHQDISMEEGIRAHTLEVTKNLAMPL